MPDVTQLARATAGAQGQLQKPPHACSVPLDPSRLYMEAVGLSYGLPSLQRSPV